MSTVAESSNKERETVCCPDALFGRWTSESLTDELLNGTRDWLMSLQQDSLVSRSPLPDSNEGRMTHAICGPLPLTAFAVFDPDAACWRTCQGCLPGVTDTLDRYSATWPRAGTMSAGVACRQPKWERRINEIASGLWPTPRANKRGLPDSHGKPMDLTKKWSNDLPDAVAFHGGTMTRQKWPTARSRDYKGSGKDCLDKATGGQLNPDWTEWLMGFPIAWTDLRPLATDRFRQWLQQHGVC